MSIIKWDDAIFLLGITGMDNTHREFISLLNGLASADNKDFARLFDQLIEHTQQHFQREEELMTEYNFPAYAEHKDEHQRVLGELNQFKKRVDIGLITFARNYINARMPEWFNLHAASMDSALAAHLKNNMSASGGN